MLFHNQECPSWGELHAALPTPRLMDQVSALCRRRHLSRRTEDAYRFWIRRCILFHHKQHPRVLCPQGIAPFINDLAVNRHVAASTQSQALNAILFLFRDVLELEVGHLDGLRRVQRPSRRAAQFWLRLSEVGDSGPIDRRGSRGTCWQFPKCRSGITEIRKFTTFIAYRWFLTSLDPSLTQRSTVTGF